MYLILKCDLIHPYVDKSKTRILGRREYLLEGDRPGLSRKRALKLLRVALKDFLVLLAFAYLA